MTLTGIDASRHQGTVDWGMVRNAGHSFAFIKATDGIAYKYITWFHLNLPQVKAAGLVPGAYHFLVDHHPGDAQARYYVQEVNRAGGFQGVVPVVDIEREADGTTPRIEHLRAFVAEFRRLVPGRPILIYTGRWYWVGVIGNPYGADLGPLWHSEYDGVSPIDEAVANGPELDNYGGWTAATVWQHTSSGSCPGVAGSVDLNLFYGTAADLVALAGGSAPTPYPEVLMPFPVVYVPGDPNRATFLALYPGGYETLDAEEYDAGVASGLLTERMEVTIRQYDVAADLALRMTPAHPPQPAVPCEVDEAAIAAAVVAAIPGLDPAATAAAVETIVRRVINETSLKA